MLLRLPDIALLLLLCFDLQECNLAGKPVYVTRVVDTMTDAPRPTRAEATGMALSSTV
jgi:pyruvate kinase